MITFMWCVAVLWWFLAALGIVLAFTLNPAAASMGLGCLITAPFITWVAWMMDKIDNGE